MLCVPDTLISLISSLRSSLYLHFLLRMSVFNRLTPLIPQVPAYSGQTKEHPSVCLSPPLSLTSPVIKKKPIQIPSFDEKGLIYEKHNTRQKDTGR